MNAFGIFMIILTVAYVLYYATLITIDWNKKEPTTQTVESVDVEGVIDQDAPIEEEEDVEEEEESLHDNGIVVSGGGTDENQDDTRYMPTSEPASNVPDEIPEVPEETKAEETSIENALAVERQAEGVSHSASTQPTENSQQVPSVLPISPDGEKPTNEEPLGDEDFDPFSYTPSVSPYNVVSVVSQPKQRTEADDRADAVNGELEEPLINSYDDVGDGEMEQLMRDEKALSEKKIVYSHELQSL